MNELIESRTGFQALTRMIKEAMRPRSTTEDIEAQYVKAVSEHIRQALELPNIDSTNRFITGFVYGVMQTLREVDRTKAGE